MTSHSSTAEPLRVTLARRVTDGDHKYVDQIRNDPTFDNPCLQASCLAKEMEFAGCFVIIPLVPDYPHESISWSPAARPNLAMLAKPHDGRLQSLADDFERRWLPKVSCR
jgi:hypothetical protein